MPVAFGLHHPVLVEDPDFDVSAHVFHAAIPVPPRRRRHQPCPTPAGCSWALLGAAADYLKYDIWQFGPLMKSFIGNLMELIKRNKAAVSKWRCKAWAGATNLRALTIRS